MKIPLNSFEQYIDETILKRGLQYFKKGLVHEPEELMSGEYEAIVEGTEPYTVNLMIKNDMISEYVCTCPYDMGPVCKHVAAVIFYLQQNELDLNVKPSQKKAGAAKNPKKKTVARQIDEIIEKLSHDDLKEYIKELCIKDNNFRHQFLAQYASLVIPDSKDLYAGQIRHILKTAVGRNGYIGYSEAGHVGSAVQDLLSRAEMLLEATNYKTAIFISCAVLEEMTKALEFADDSNGDIGGSIQGSVNILSDISQQTIDETLRKELYNYCLKSWHEQLFKGFDWHYAMLDIAVELAVNETEANQIHIILDQVKPNNTDWDWDLQEAQRIRVNLIRRTESEEKAID